MNSYMTASTQYPQVLNVINLVRRIYVMNVKLFLFRFADETLMGIFFKGPLSVKTRTFSKVRIFSVGAFERIKSNLFAFIRAKFNVFSSLFKDFLSTNLASYFDFPRRMLAAIQKAFSRAKSYSFILAAINVGRSFEKMHSAFSTYQLNFGISRFIVTSAATKLISPLFEFLVTCQTALHTLILTLSIDKVKQQPAGGPNG